MELLEHAKRTKIPLFTKFHVSCGVLIKGKRMGNASFLMISAMILLSTTGGCSKLPKGANKDCYIVKMTTNKGDMIIELSNETPQHRDNFVKLAKDGFYNGLAFHRVIKDFMIQGGDPDTRNFKAGTQYGSGDLGYTVPAEFVPSLFHKKGALAAARTGDNVNPEKRSSASQFYIVQGKVTPAEEIDQLVASMDMQRRRSAGQMAVNQYASENMEKLRSMPTDKANKLIDSVGQAAASAAQGFSMNDAQRNAYTTIGGTPFLDGEYTVYGQVIQGLEVVDAIANCETDSMDCPKEIVKIEKVEIINTPKNLK